jgi:hypothetical protein
MASAEPITPVGTADETLPKAATPKSAAVVSSGFASDRLLPKNVWVAALLTLVLGPPGMIYSTPLGALVMSLVSIPSWFYGGPMLVTAVWCVSIIWAVMAARP